MSLSALLLNESLHFYDHLGMVSRHLVISVECGCRKNLFDRQGVGSVHPTTLPNGGQPYLNIRTSQKHVLKVFNKVEKKQPHFPFNFCPSNECD